MNTVKRSLDEKLEIADLIVTWTENRDYDQTGPGRLGQLAEIVIPFGKYRGRRFKEVPLTYLDQTISVMPPSWLIRRAQEFVDIAMQLYAPAYENLEVPNKSVDRLEASGELGTDIDADKEGFLASLMAERPILSCDHHVPDE